MADIITDRQPCPPKEAQELLDYLEKNSHVQLPVMLIQQGCPVEKGQAKGVGNIGRLQTCFKNLGNAYCQSLNGAEFFLVAQALEALTNPNYRLHPDIADVMQKIHQYKYLFARPDPAPKVTVVELGFDVLIADGDKSAIAAFLYALETSQPDFILPVYYIVSPPDAQVQSAP
jgi:hypothetical protein